MRLDPFSWIPGCKPRDPRSKRMDLSDAPNNLEDDLGKPQLGCNPWCSELPHQEVQVVVAHRPIQRWLWEVGRSWEKCVEVCGASEESRFHRIREQPDSFWGPDQQTATTELSDAVCHPSYKQPKTQSSPKFLADHNNTPCFITNSHQKPFQITTNHFANYISLAFDSNDFERRSSYIGPSSDGQHVQDLSATQEMLHMGCFIH